MSYPPFCIACNSKTKQKNSNRNKTQLYWNSDFSAEDYGYENEGIVGVYSCPDEECGAVYEIMDFFLENREDQRVIKYSRYDEDYIEKQEEKMISTCLHCASKLENKGSSPTTDVYGIEFECDGVTTTLQCPECKTVYDVVDLYPADELFNDVELDIRDSRTIFLK